MDPRIYVVITDPVTEIRASGYRAFRHIIVDKNAARRSWKENLDVFLVWYVQYRSICLVIPRPVP
jgi:hypothetical protein